MYLPQILDARRESTGRPWELIVDNFAGGGGASTGIRAATGRDPDIAINHDREAIAMYEANHPGTTLYCEDVFKVDPIAVTGGRPVGLCWLSPDCKHFSKAKGGKPKSKKIRGLAWVSIKWAATARPRVIVLENVEEFETWGPLMPDGSPCPARKGNTFRNFVARLRNLGYHVEWRLLRACDYGAPTIRRRLFLIARRDYQPIVWPEPTHYNPKAGRKPTRRGMHRWRTAAECIDWSIPCPSIFDRKKPLAEATLRRIARGIRKFVVESADPFIIPLGTVPASNEFAVATAFLTEHANASKQRIFAADEAMRTQCGEVKGGHFAQVTAFLAKHYGGHETPGASPSQPIDTVTAVDHHAVVAAHITKLHTGSTGSAADEPIHTITDGTGLAAIAAVNLVRHFGESIGSEANEPVGSVTAGGMGKTAIAVSHLSKLYGTTTGQDPQEPMHTVTGQGGHIAEVRAFLIKYYSEGGQDQDINDPMHTVTSKARLGLVTIHGCEYVITDIGMRMLTPRELFNAQGFPRDYIIDLIAPDKKGRRRPLPKTSQVRMCGNSVCPPAAAAIVRSNYNVMTFNPSAPFPSPNRRGLARAA